MLERRGEDRYPLRRLTAVRGLPDVGLVGSRSILFASADEFGSIEGSVCKNAQAHSMLEWNDLEVILAVGRAGTLSGAARHLGINHSTVFRKVNAIEERVGVRFFDRLPTGYRMTQAREAALSCAERIERTNAPCSTRADGAPLPSVEVA